MKTIKVQMTPSTPSDLLPLPHFFLAEDGTRDAGAK
jgi:hypothetical protein